MTSQYALISVFDKRGIVDFTRKLTTFGISVISTGGTAKKLTDAQIPHQMVSDLTGFPEMLNGRVKTLHPRIHAGILANRSNKTHLSQLKNQQIAPIDFVICNLYPFEQTIKHDDVSIETVIENIDIGGPTLIRAAAKNYQDVVVVTRPDQYEDIITALTKQNSISADLRKQLAVEAFSHTARYDAIISTYLRNRWTEHLLPRHYSITLDRIQQMRYGENPHQQAAFYRQLPPIKEPCIANAAQLQGKELSFNNILDADCAIEAIKEFKDPTCVIIKHATPCGIASAPTLLQAWNDAYATDVYSPFGGIVSFNRTVDESVAKALSEFFLEIVIAPQYSTRAQSLFSKKKNLRLLTVEGLDKPQTYRGISFRSVVGGVLAQQQDTFFTDPSRWKQVTKKKPSKKQLQSMAFAVHCVKHVKSNAVLFVKETKTVAIGGGQTSRVDATWIATHKGKENIRGSTMASDAFFPFRDTVDVAAEAGVEAIIQPGGSIRDNEVIQAADEHNIAMVFSGQRYFRH